MKDTLTTPRRRWLWAGALIAAVSLCGLSRAAPDTKPAEKPAPAVPVVVPEGERLEFTQKNIQAQMEELQDRMFRLSELTRQAEPESSARLVLAVKKAREQLIIEQMKDVLEKLSTRDLTHASAETREVLAKLEALRNLLVAADLDLQMQLERLRAINGAIKKIDAAIVEEKKEQTRSDELAKKPDDAKPALDREKKDQEDNHKRATEVADALKTLGNLDNAVKPLANSGQSMSKAEGSLGAGKPGEASPSQSDAKKQLEDAKRELEKARQQTLAEMQKQVKAIVMEHLRDMLDRETLVHAATENLSTRPPTDRQVVQQFKQLAPAQERIAGICHETLDLVNEAEFSVALPPALEDLERNMYFVAGDLAGGRGDKRVLAEEAGIEEDLRSLLETFRDMSQDGKAGECKGCKGNKNKLSAELKVLKMLQLRINRETLDADADAHRAAAAAELPRELRDKIGKVRDGQDAVRNAMEQVHDRFGPNSQAPEDDNDPDAI